MKEEIIRKEILKARQRAVSKAGNEWENYVENFLKESFRIIYETASDEEVKRTIKDIEIRRIGKRSEIESIKHNFPKLYQSLFIPIINFAKDKKLLLEMQQSKDIITNIFDKGVIGDTDIVIVSCKVSLHGRLTETLFYSLYYRITNRIKFVLATPDKGKQSREDVWQSEWGSPDNPSKDRILATLFLDGVYVDNVPEFMPKGFDPNKDKTILGGIVRYISELPLDILRWYEDIKFSV